MRVVLLHSQRSNHQTTLTMSLQHILYSLALLSFSIVLVAAVSNEVQLPRFVKYATFVGQ